MTDVDSRDCSPQTILLPTMPDPSSRPKRPRRWVVMLSGVGVMFLSFCAFDYLGRLEYGQAQPDTMPLLFLLLHHAGSRWCALLGGGAIGAFAVWVGIKTLVLTVRDRRTTPNG